MGVVTQAYLPTSDYSCWANSMINNKLLVINKYISLFTLF
jgi:hypothetical protein